MLTVALVVVPVRSEATDTATLLWDGLAAHRSNAMRTWLNTQRSWVVVERLPAYAPEPTLAEVIQQAHRGIDRIRRTPHLAYSFLGHADPSVS
jgi:hypothetical protein